MPDDNQCKHEIHEQTNKNIEAASTDAKLNNECTQEIDSGEDAAVDSGDGGAHVKGARRKAASSVLMHIRYAARMARPDLLRPPRQGSPHMLPNGAQIGARNHTDWFVTFGARCITYTRDTLHKVMPRHCNMLLIHMHGSQAD